ncbi:MAG: PQQ-binding-like beta-propeller repeat protein [Clostridiaceae bacterium]|nr:PQQ-binding-like beta-propeller repeat protein [Clostridiaceae bacterium]
MKRYYRRKRRFNPVKFLTFLIFIAMTATVITLAVKGKLSFRSDDLKADGNSTPISTPDTTPVPETSQQPPGTVSPNPTPWPTPEPMPEESTDRAVLDVSWEDPAVFTGAMAYNGDSKTFYKSDGTTMDYWVFENNQPVEYIPKDEISFGSSEDYADLKGVTAFRGNNYRDTASYGTRTINEKKLEIVWSHETGVIKAENSIWPGTGWTGQPLLVNWPEDIRKMMNIKAEYKEKDLVEVIYPTLDGSIYFLDLETGRPTREKINVGFPMKGTGMVDPRGYPIFYVGMGLNENGDNITEFKYKIFSLIDQTPMYDILGRDPVAFRKWGAFDSSAILDKKTDTLIEAAENGLVYRVKLNTNFDREAGTISVAPQLTKYRYKDSTNIELGIENSPAYYKNYMYFCDNGGIFQCLDLNTLKPVWTYDVGDDTDSSPVIEVTDEGVFVYTANQVDKRSQISKGRENANIRKFNALTGDLIWQKDYSCVYSYYINGGVLGTPLLGKDDISDIIIFTVCFTGTAQDGILVALDKKTGEEVWRRQLDAYSWCSPVAVRSSEGKTYGLFTDFHGLLHLFDPKTGKDLDTVSLGANIESSPAVYDDMIVVGSYAKKIFGIKIK